MKFIVLCSIYFFDYWLASAQSNAPLPYIKGTIQVLGAQANARVHVLELGGKATQKLCKNQQSDALAKVTGTEVTITGTVKNQNSRSKRCVEMKSVSFEKSSSGNPLIAGTLKREAEKLYVYDDAGKRRELKNRPSGIENQIGKKILLVMPKEKTYPEDTDSVFVETFLEYPN